MRRRFSFGRRDESGAMLVLAAVSLVVVMISAALAVDLGRLGQEKRVDQRVADLAALDAARSLIVTDPSNNALVRAQKSVQRNDFHYDTSGWGLEGQDLNVCYGLWNTTARLFVADPTGLLCNVEPPSAAAVAPFVKAVRVKVESPFSSAFPFVDGPDAASASAIATANGLVAMPTTTTAAPATIVPPASTPKAGFTLGSSLVNFNSSSSALLNPIMSGWLGGTVSLSVASWQGLANGRVTLDGLKTSLDYGAGTVDQMLNANVTLGQLMSATATALTSQGDLATANIITGAGGLTAAANSTTQFRLGDLITIAQGSESAALAASMNVYELVTGSAQLSNKNRAVSVSNLGVSVPNVASTKLSINVIEAPKMYYGPAAGPTPALHTAQVELLITPTVNIIGLDVLGDTAQIDGEMPIRVMGAAANGVLSTINCSASPKTITVGVTTQAASATQDAPALNVTIRSSLGLVLAASTLTAHTTMSAGSGSFTAQFSEASSGSSQLTPATRHVGVTTLNAEVTADATGDAVIDSVNNVLVGATGLLSVATGVDSNVTQPLLRLLGADIGGADVSGIGPIQDCSATPGPTTTTVPPPTTTSTTTTTVAVPQLVQ